MAKRHVMIDIETLGTNPSAPVVSIGAVCFDKNGLIGPEFYAECSIESAVKGAKLNMSTIVWWLKQADAPRLKLANASGTSNEMWQAFVAWFPNRVEGVWGNGATFDNVLVREALKREKIKCPWQFWSDRCYRTVKSMYPKVEMERVGDHHNALDDAKSQACHLIKINDQHGDFL